MGVVADGAGWRIALTISANAPASALVVVSEVDAEQIFWATPAKAPPASVSAAVSIDVAIFDIPSPAEMRQALVGSLSDEAVAALLVRLRPVS